MQVLWSWITLEPSRCEKTARVGCYAISTLFSRRYTSHKPKHPLTLTGATFCGFTLKEENLFLVICDFRRTNSNVWDDLPANTIVLDREQLEALYTPSLASRVQFICNERDKMRKEESGENQAAWSPCSQQMFLLIHSFFLSLFYFFVYPHS